MADPMTPERLAEIREREQAAPIGPWLHVRGFPQALHNGGDDILAEFYQDIDAEPTAARFVAAARQDVPALLAEVERLRAELEEIRTTETDVTWLADGVRRIIDGVSVRTAKDPAHAQSMIAREAVSLINAGILTSFVSSRVVDLSVDRIRQAETERDAAREQVKDTEQAVHAYFADADQRGIHLDGMTVDELCDAVMAAIRTEPGQ